jgi:hypothetical protein
MFSPRAVASCKKPVAGLVAQKVVFVALTRFRQNNPPFLYQSRSAAGFLLKNQMPVAATVAEKPSSVSPSPLLVA